MKKKLKKKGFTLVEVLAVIVILGIIMIISVPSVFSTLETARKKTFLEYVDKIINTGKSKWILYSSNPYPQPEDMNYYMFDLKEDLGFDNMGDYVGMFVVMECDDTVCEWENDGLLGADLYMEYGDVRFIVYLGNEYYTGAYDSKNDNRIIEDTNPAYFDLYKNTTKSYKEIFSYMQLLSKCNTRSQAIINTKNNEILGTNENHSSNYIDNVCTDYTDEESMYLFMNYLNS